MIHAGTKKHHFHIFPSFSHHLSIIFPTFSQRMIQKKGVLHSDIPSATRSSDVKICSGGMLDCGHVTDRSASKPADGQKAKMSSINFWDWSMLYLRRLYMNQPANSNLHISYMYKHIDIYINVQTCIFKCINE